MLRVVVDNKVVCLYGSLYIMFGVSVSGSKKDCEFDGCVLCSV